jgi:hypothetical protein
LWAVFRFSPRKVLEELPLILFNQEQRTHLSCIGQTCKRRLHRKRRLNKIPR